MPFRHRKFKTPVEVSDERFITRQRQQISESSDCVQFTVVSVSDEQISRAIPSPSDYTLEKLLNANVPLSQVHLSLDDSPTESNINTFVSNNLKLDSHED